MIYGAGDGRNTDGTHAAGPAPAETAGRLPVPAPLRVAERGGSVVDEGSFGSEDEAE